MSTRPALSLTMMLCWVLLILNLQRAKGFLPVRNSNPQMRVWLWMLPVLLLVTGLGANWLTVDLLWNDEILSLAVAGAGYYQPQPISLDISWPPLYFIILAFWDKVMGGQVLFDRTLSLFIGMLAVALIYQLGRTLFSARVGLIAALMLASSAFFINYLHEIRAYSLYVMTCTLCAWFYWLVQDKRYSRYRWIRWSFVLSVALALYTHYIAAATILAIAIYHIVERPSDLRTASDERNQWLQTLRLGINGCLLYAPWSAIFFSSLLSGSGKATYSTLTDFLYGMLHAYTNGLWWFVLPLLLISIFYIRQREVRFLWIWIGVTLLIAIFGNLEADFLAHPRHVIGIMPPIILTLAFMLHQHRFPVLMLFVGIWMGAGVIHSTTPTFMGQLPIQIPPLPSELMDTIIDMDTSCIEADEWVLLGFDTPERDWHYDVPLGVYARDYELQLVRMTYLIQDNGRDNVNVIDEQMGATYLERLDYVTQGKSIWLFTLPDAPIQREIVSFNHAMLERGYHSCPLVTARNVINRRVYLPDNMSCEQIIATCGR